MYASVSYVLPVDLDVLGLVLVLGVVKIVGVHCYRLTAFPQGHRLSCRARGVMGTRVGREVQRYMEKNKKKVAGRDVRGRGEV